MKVRGPTSRLLLWVSTGKVGAQLCSTQATHQSLSSNGRRAGDRGLSSRLLPVTSSFLKYSSGPPCNLFFLHS